jgi:phosphohistidine phosphatase
MIWLVHHGEALPPEVDAMRPLSPHGREAVTRLAEQARARGVKPDLLWHSGKLRARQTAEAFWRACNPLAPLTAVRGLQPDDPPAWMRDQLAGETRSILLAGLMPHLPALLRLLRGDGGDTSPGFPMHGVVALEADGDSWKEVWRLNP